MNNIHRIEGYNNVPPIGPNTPGGPERQPPVSSAGQSEDQVQISKIAVYMSKISSLPEIRTEKVEAIREALQQGTYDIEGKLSAALERMFDEENVV